MKFINKLALYSTGLFAVTLLCLALVSVAKPGHASAAYSTDLNCTDSSTEFNVVVVARVYDYYGNLKGYANNYTFHVNAYEKTLAYRDKRANGTWKPWVYYDSRSGNMGYPSGHDQYSNETIAWMNMKSEAIRWWDSGYYSHTGVNADFAVQMDGNYIPGNLSGSGMASGKGNACQIGSTMVPTYAFRDGDNTHHVTLATANSYGSAANYPSKVWVGTEALGHDGNNHSWSLSCLGQNDGSTPINSMYFGFWPTNWDYSYVTSAQAYSSRATAAGGGWWSPGVELWAANATSTTIYFDYHEPAPPTPPTITPVSAITNNTDPVANVKGYIEPGSTYSASGSVTASASNNGGSVNATWRVWYDMDQVDNGEPQVAGGTANLTFGAGGGTQPIGAVGPTAITNAIADTYNFVCSRVIINSVSGSPTPLIAPPGSDQHCLSIERHPYFQVQGGDVNAAASLMAGSVCSPATGTIAGYNNGLNGASTNIAAFAASAITEFASGGTPRPYGLTFSNTPLSAWGGGSDQTFCINDSEFTGPEQGTNVPPMGAVTITSNETHYATGDVYITNDINYPANFNMDDSMPFYKIATTGNIYIRKNVTQLSGLLMAKGTIYTCAEDDLANPGKLRAPTLAEIKSDCQPVLTVNGALVAGTVKLLRSSGTVLNPAPAEKIIFSPEVWLRSINPSPGGGGNTTLGPVDSITSLPPVL